MNFECLKEFITGFSKQISSDIVALSDLQPSDISVCPKYLYLDKALVEHMNNEINQYKVSTTSTTNISIAI